MAGTFEVEQQKIEADDVTSCTHESGRIKLSVSGHTQPIVSIPVSRSDYEKLVQEIKDKMSPAVRERIFHHKGQYKD